MLNEVLNVKAYQKAIGREQQKLHEAPIPLSAEANFGALAMGSLPGRGEIVEVVPLDAMLADIAKIELLKVDVEGWELDVLDGSRALIDRDRPILHVENERPRQVSLSARIRLSEHAVHLEGAAIKSEG